MRAAVVVLLALRAARPRADELTDADFANEIRAEMAEFGTEPGDPAELGVNLELRNESPEELALFWVPPAGGGPRARVGTVARRPAGSRSPAHAEAQTAQV